MSKKLKTLREITTEIISNTKLCKQNWIQQTSTVEAYMKEEAIKWVKENKKAIIYPFGKNIPILDGKSKYGKYANSEKWIMHFFNISQEDIDKFKKN